MSKFGDIHDAFSPYSQPNLTVSKSPACFSVYIVDGLQHPIFVGAGNNVEELDEFIVGRVKTLFKAGWNLEIRIYPLLLDIGQASIKTYKEIRHLPFVAICIRRNFTLKWYKYDRYPLLDFVKLPKFAQFKKDLTVLKDQLDVIKTYDALCNFANTSGIDVLSLANFKFTSCFKLRGKFTLRQLKKLIILTWLDPIYMP